MRFARHSAAARTAARRRAPECRTVARRARCRATRARLFRAFLEELESSSPPTAIVFEEVHWADEATLPILVGSTAVLAHNHTAHGATGGGVSTLLVHTFAMFSVMSAAALAAYRVAGVGFLRRAWINFDFISIGALFAAGVLTLVQR